MAKHWIEMIQNLTAAALTVRAQAIDPTNRGQLKWNMFFPRADVMSTQFKDVMTLDDRFVADRREWNGNGRQIPIRTPEMRDVSFTPIESYQKIGEQELQKMADNAMGNQEVVTELIAANLPRRVDAMTMANYRRLEIDCVNAWVKGQIIQTNPETGANYTVSFGFAGSRLQTAGTAWNNGATNAYTNFVAWLKDARGAVGALAGAVMRQNVLNEILNDAPASVISGFKLTQRELEQRISDELGSTFSIAIWEDGFDVFTDGGTAATRTSVFPAGYIAAVPVGGSIGSSAFAPVYRARSIAAETPEARVDINGVAVFYNSENDGKILKPTVQLNAFPVPNEQFVYAINTGIS